MSLQAVARNDAADFAVTSLARVTSLSLEFAAASSVDDSIKNEIADFLDSQHTSHPFQYPHWTDGNSYFAMVRKDGHLRWYANCGVQYPLSTRVAMVRSVFVNRGPVCDDPDLWNASLHLLQRELSERGFVHLDVAPDWASLGCGGYGAGARASLRLDLKADEDQLFAGFRKNTRYEIRRAERLGVSVVKSNSPEQVEEFIALHQRMAERKNFSPDSADHIRHIVGWFMREQSRGALLMARHDGALLGGVVVVRAGQRCWYVWGATGRHDDVNAGHILQWHALRWAKSHGCTEYDFGGYTLGAASGPAWFKQGFGGRVVEFPPTRRSILRPWYHYLLRRLSRA